MQDKCMCGAPFKVGDRVRLREENSRRYGHTNVVRKVLTVRRVAFNHYYKTCWGEEVCGDWLVSADGGGPCKSCGRYFDKAVKELPAFWFRKASVRRAKKK